MSVLRNKLAAANAECHVLKNSLIKKAAEMAKIDAIADLPLTDGTALVCGSGDCIRGESGGAHGRID